MSSTTQSKVHIGVQMPADMVAALRERAQLEDRSMSSLVRRAIADTLAEPAVDARIRPGGDAGRFEAGR